MQIEQFYDHVKTPTAVSYVMQRTRPEFRVWDRMGGVGATRIGNKGAACV